MEIARPAEALQASKRIVVAFARSPLIRANPLSVSDWFEDQCMFIDQLIASSKIDRFPSEAEVVPHLMNAFGLTLQEAVEALHEWERRQGRR
jgi:hypothetical protein